MKPLDQFGDQSAPRTVRQPVSMPTIGAERGVRAA
jgi:hypothetical protein